MAAPSVYLYDHRDQPMAGLSMTGPSGQFVDTDLFPSIIQQNLRPLVDRPRAYVARGVGYLPTLPRCRLLIVGGGHVGQAVAELASISGICRLTLAPAAPMPSAPGSRRPVPGAATEEHLPLLYPSTGQRPHPVLPSHTVSSRPSSSVSRSSLTAYNEWRR